jgi:hypothetical protein
MTADGPAFERTRWNMTSQQVRRLYPSARAQADDLLLEKPFGELPARIRFRFVRDALSVVELDLAGDGATLGDASLPWAATSSPACRHR